MPTRYEVTATALNLRASPSAAGDILTVLRRGQQCVGAGDAQDGWLPVSYQQWSGYLSSNYVRVAAGTAVVPASTPAPAPVSAPAGGVPLPADPQMRLNSLSQLHPQFRQALSVLLDKTAAEGRPFKVFEAFRTPERQRWLYEQGRSRAGGIVTNAKPWESFHQYGLAVDLVLFVNGQWTWSSEGDLGAHWKRLPELAKAAGLRTLTWEAPHVEWPVALREAAGPALQASADEGWADTLASAAARWRSAGGSGAPELAPAQRPPAS